MHAKERGFCSTCQKLIIQPETGEHTGHALEWGITDAQLKNPTQLISARTHKDREAVVW